MTPFKKKNKTAVQLTSAGVRFARIQEMRHIISVIIKAKWEEMGTRRAHAGGLLSSH